MQFHVPDPAFTGSEQARAHFWLAVKIAFGFIALIWLIYLVQWGLDLGPEPFGIRPRQLDGLPGIVFAPLVHGSFAHLIANSPPLLVLGNLQHCLVLPAAHPPLVAGCALRLERAVRADVGPVGVDPHAVLDGRVVSAQTLSRWTLVFIVTRNVDDRPC